MSRFTKRFKESLKSQRGMTLPEVLTAMTLLVLIIMVFTPLFMQYYRNVKVAGDMSQQTYKKASLMERLSANRGNNGNSYETYCADVPIKFTSKANNKVMSFEGMDEGVDGTFVMSNYQNPSPNDYVTYYGASNGKKMSCFPNTISDDFSEKTIFVVATGFEFEKGKDFTLSVTVGTDGDTTKVTRIQNGKHYKFNSSTDYIKDLDGKLTIAKITLFGANDTICFENSPLIIQYEDAKPLRVAITAPEIILVGEGTVDGASGDTPGSESNRYYYATSGLPNQKTGQLEIIAKTMKGDAALKSAMNDVEWVQPGMGDNMNGDKNTYGYYVMGGDAGQIRRFQLAKNGKNYMWGGDNVVQYSRYYNLDAVTSGSWLQAKDRGGSWEGSYNSGGVFQNKTLAFVNTTEATSSTIFGSTDRALRIYSHNGSLIDNGNVFLYTNKPGVGTYKYALFTYSYSTITTDKQKTSKGTNFSNARAYYVNGTKETDSDENWNLFPEADRVNMNVEGYKKTTGYKHDNTITITSVGAIPVFNEYVANGTSPVINSNIYPTQPYTLYTGYIPAIINVGGLRYRSSGLDVWTFQATLGAAKGSDGKIYPTAKFGDTHTNSSITVGGKNSFADLLGWKTDKSMLATKGNDYYITSQNEVDITIGYMSHPYATSTNNVANPAEAILGGSLTSPKGSDYIFTRPDGTTGKSSGKNADNENIYDGKFEHSFLGSGLRDFVTLLDVKSWHDDIKNKNFSVAGGYTFSLFGNDYDDWTRMGQVMNTGLVFIRATGDGTNNDTSGSVASGKGWTLAYETNVFHQFYGTDQYQDLKDAYVFAARGWDTRYHKSYHNMSTLSERAPQYTFKNDGWFRDGKTYATGPSATKNMKGFEAGKNTHPMEFCKVDAVNKGSSSAGDTELMFGTSNGTLLSWAYKQESNNQTSNDSKITGVTKEFENYRWIDLWEGKALNGFASANMGSTGLLNNSWSINKGVGVQLQNYKQAFYDYHSVAQKTSDQHGFISVLDSVNDVCYGDGIWVAVGNYSGKKPGDYCASSSAYSSSSDGTYINVRLTKTNVENSDSLDYYWKAVKVSNAKIDVESVSFCNGYWYIAGTNKDTGAGVFMYSGNPEAENWQLISSANVYATSGGKISSVTLSKINSMASQEG